MPFEKIASTLARPYPHGYVDPMRTSGRYSHLAEKLSRGEVRAREAGTNPGYWRGMLGVMNMYLKQKPGPLGPDMHFKDMLNDMTGLLSGKGKISLKDALKAWENP